jgi:hemolysin activation/secretion protein
VHAQPEAEPGAAVPGSAAQPEPSDGRFYPVDGLSIHYIDPNPQFPSPEEMAQTEIEFGRVVDGLVAPRADTPVMRVRVADLPQLGVQRLYGSAIRTINQQLVFEFNRRDFHAIVVAPLPEDIEKRTGRDLRPPGETRLRLGVYAGRVMDLRTFAAGERYENVDDKLDLPRHAWVRENSPIQPGTTEDLVRKDRIDAYLARLNRYASRRVEAEISPARTAGGVNLDYIVAENKPWWAYVQYDDTGTEETTKYRQRFGFVHSQLTERDDIIQLDYITGDFDSVHAVVGSYEFPIQRGGRLRARIFGDWSDFDASVLGFDDAFTSKQIDAGATLIANVFQFEDLFADLYVGGKYQEIEVDSFLSGIEEKADFALGILGTRVERVTASSTFYGDVSLEQNFASVDHTTLANLGRQAADQSDLEDDFEVLRWNLSLSAFPIHYIVPRSWRDPAYLDSTSYAHEVYLAFRGQDSLGNRLIPQQEQVIGGLYTVRGYPEATVVGDDVMIGTLEYRLHVPRLFAPSAKPVLLPVIGTFRTRPQYAYSFPDWDLILRAFADAGRNDFSKQIATEQDDTLVGAGVGVEIQFKRYLRARVDWGFALHDADEGGSNPVDAGDQEIHFSATLLY